MTNIRDKIFGMPSSAREVLRCLFLKGPTWDGNVPSKNGRDELVRLGYVERWNGWQWLTLAGIKFAVEVMLLDREKDKR
jgi:hypothetical protein